MLGGTVGKTRRGVVAGIVLGATMFVSSASAAVGANPVATDGTNGRVSAIAFSNQTAYIGGSFTTAGGVDRNHAAAINTTTGKVTPWNPNISGFVQAIAISGNTVVLGGSFAKIGDTVATRLAAVDKTTGQVIWKASMNKQVMALDIANGKVYAGGYFTTANGASRGYLAAFDLATGALDPSWTPRADLEVKALGVTSDNGTVVVGGDFTHMNDASASHLTAVNATTGANVSWRTHTPWAVITMAVDASGVYAGGGGGGGNFAKFDQSGRQLWKNGTDGNVQGITQLAGVVYVGGHYENFCGSVGGQHICTSPIPRSKLIAVDANTGALQPWDPSANSVLGVFAMADTGMTLAVGGDFTSTGKRSQPHFAIYR